MKNGVRIKANENEKKENSDLWKSKQTKRKRKETKENMYIKNKNKKAEMRKILKDTHPHSQTNKITRKKETTKTKNIFYWCFFARCLLCGP